MLCKFLTLEGNGSFPCLNGRNIISFKLADGSDAFIRRLERHNKYKMKNYKVMFDGLKLKKHCDMYIPLCFIVGLPKNCFLTLDTLYNAKLSLLDNPTFYSSNSRETCVIHIANLTKEDVILPFSEEIIRGKIFKTKKVKEPFIEDVVCVSGPTASEFLSKIKDEDDQHKKSKKAKKGNSNGSV